MHGMFMTQCKNNDVRRISVHIYEKEQYVSYFLYYKAIITKLNKACQSQKSIFITQLHNAEISVGTLKYLAVKTLTILVSERVFF